MISKYPVFSILLLLCILCLSGCTGSPQDPAPALSQTTVPKAPSAATVTATVPVALPAATTAETPAVIQTTGLTPSPQRLSDGHYSKTYSFEGTGDFTQEFTTDSGRTWVFRMNCPKAKEIFLATIKDENGDDIEVLADEGGAYAGSKSVFLKAGNYYLDVAADSPWTITMSTA